MAGELAAAGLGVASDIGSSIITNLGNRRAQKRAQRYNIENWNRQNLYNHPIQQMERLQSAGLNPNLIYGSSGSTAMGQSEQIPDVKPAPYEMKSPGENFSRYYQMKETAAQTDNLRIIFEQIQKDIELKEAQRLNVLQDTINKIPTETKLSAEASVAKELADVDLATKQISQDKQQKELDILTAQEQNIVKTTAQTLRNLEAQGRNINAGTAKIHVEKEIQDLIKAALPPGTKPGDSWFNRKIQQIFNEAKRLAQDQGYKASQRNWNKSVKQYKKQ